LNEKLIAFRTVGPVTVLIDGSTMQHYKSGIFNGVDPKNSEKVCSKT
jgi:hypothetical protein